MKFLVVLALIISAVLICQANVNVSVDVDVEVTVPDPLDLINNVSHSLFEVYKASVVALRKRCLDFANEVKSDAADVANNVKSDVANIANDVKSDISNVANDVAEAADQAVAATLDALNYMQDEVNLVTADFQLAVDKLSDFIDQALRAGNEKIQDVKHIWDALRHGTRRLTRDINKLRSYVIDKVKAISKKFGRETKEFQLAMKELYTDVQRKLFYEIRRTWSMFKNALQLPLKNYFEIDLQFLYKDWTQLLHFVENKPLEILYKTRDLLNAVNNAVLTKFFLAGSLLQQLDWSRSILALQDAVQIKRIVDFALQRLENYLNNSMTYVYSQYGKDTAAFDDAAQALYLQTLEELKILIALTEIPFLRAYCLPGANMFFNVPTLDATYKGQFVELLKYLQQQNYPIHLDENEFTYPVLGAPETPLEDIQPRSIPSESPDLTQRNMTGNKPGRIFYQLPNESEIPFDYPPGRTCLHKGPVRRPGPNVYANIMHEKSIQEITEAYSLIFRDIRRRKDSVHKDVATYLEMLMMKLKDDSDAFSLTVNYLKAYVAQCAVFIDDAFNESYPGYVDVLVSLNEDVMFRFDVIAFYTSHSLKRTCTYLTSVSHQTPSWQHVMQNSNFVNNKFEWFSAKKTDVEYSPELIQEQSSLSIDVSNQNTIQTVEEQTAQGTQDKKELGTTQNKEIEAAQTSTLQLGSENASQGTPVSEKVVMAQNSETAGVQMQAARISQETQMADRKLDTVTNVENIQAAESKQQQKTELTTDKIFEAATNVQNIQAAESKQQQDKKFEAAINVQNIQAAESKQKMVPQVIPQETTGTETRSLNQNYSNQQMVQTQTSEGEELTQAKGEEEEKEESEEGMSMFASITKELTTTNQKIVNTVVANGNSAEGEPDTVRTFVSGTVKADAKQDSSLVVVNSSGEGNGDVTKQVSKGAEMSMQNSNSSGYMNQTRDIEAQNNVEQQKLPPNNTLSVPKTVKPESGESGEDLFISQRNSQVTDRNSSVVEKVTHDDNDTPNPDDDTTIFTKIFTDTTKKVENSSAVVVMGSAESEESGEEESTKVDEVGKQSSNAAKLYMSNTNSARSITPRREKKSLSEIAIEKNANQARDISSVVTTTDSTTKNSSRATQTDANLANQGSGYLSESHYTNFEYEKDRVDSTHLSNTGCKGGHQDAISMLSDAIASINIMYNSVVHELNDTLERLRYINNARAKTEMGYINLILRDAECAMSEFQFMTFILQAYITDTMEYASIQYEIDSAEYKYAIECLESDVREKAYFVVSYVEIALKRCLLHVKDGAGFLVYPTVGYAEHASQFFGYFSINGYDLSFDRVTMDAKALTKFIDQFLINISANVRDVFDDINAGLVNAYRHHNAPFATLVIGSLKEANNVFENSMKQIQNYWQFAKNEVVTLKLSEEQISDFIRGMYLECVHRVNVLVTFVSGTFMRADTFNRDLRHVVLSGQKNN